MWEILRKSSKVLFSKLKLIKNQVQKIGKQTEIGAWRLRQKGIVGSIPGVIAFFRFFRFFPTANRREIHFRLLWTTFPSTTVIIVYCLLTTVLWTTFTRLKKILHFEYSFLYGVIVWTEQSNYYYTSYYFNVLFAYRSSSIADSSWFSCIFSFWMSFFLPVSRPSLGNPMRKFSPLTSPWTTPREWR